MERNSLRIVVRAALASAVWGLMLGLSACASGPRPEARDARESGAPPVGDIGSPPARDIDAPTSAPGASAPGNAPANDRPVVSAPTAPGPATPNPRPPADGPLDPMASVRGIHDPAIIREGDWYYCFSTGYGVPIHRSRDLVTWESVGRVFRLDVPDWAKQEIPTSVNIWAPDIAFIDGRFVLTYTVATFGQNRSLIGMASTPTLDPSSREYRWRHDGKVVESFVGDDFNAIDSNLLVQGNRAVVFYGSYWTGIKMVELDRQSLKPREGAERVSVARRETSGGIEAPFVVERNGWYYMFLSFDKCCAGVDSTYNVRVGRSRNLEGPYYDRDNQTMMRGGGTTVLRTDGRMIGPGHNCIFREGDVRRAGDQGRWYIAYHFYDRDFDGVQRLQVRELLWDHLGWPRAGAVVSGGF